MVAYIVFAGRGRFFLNVRLGRHVAMAMKSFYEPNWPDKLRSRGLVQATARY